MNKTEIYSIVGDFLDSYETAKLDTAYKRIAEYKNQRNKCVTLMHRRFQLKVREIAELLNLPIPHVRNIIMESRKEGGFPK